MDRDIEADIASTRSDMSAQLARLQAIDDPVESIHAALAFEDACRQVIIDLAELCRGRLDDLAQWAQGPAIPRSRAAASGGQVDEVPQSPPAAARKRAPSRTTKVRGRPRKAAKRRR